MTAQPGPGSTPTDIPGDVERIRAILFGSQMRDYEQRFQTFQRDLSRLQQDLARLNEQTTTQAADQGQKVQGLRTEMLKADDDLRDELRQTAQKLSDEKTDRAVLGDLFIELGNHLKQGGSLTELLKVLG